MLDIIILQVLIIVLSIQLRQGLHLRQNHGVHFLESLVRNELPPEPLIRPQNILSLSLFNLPLTFHHVQNFPLQESLRAYHVSVLYFVILLVLFPDLVGGDFAPQV